MDKKNKQKRRLYELRNQEKIYRNRKKRKNKYLKGSHHINEENQGLVPSYLNVIRHLDEKEFGLNDKRLIQNGTAYITVPEEFSISERPNETISFLKKLYAAAKNKKVNKMVFNHSDCKKLGLSASTIMDIIIYSTMKYKEKSNIDVEYKGNMPQESSAREVFLASGLPYHLNAEYKMQYDKNSIERFKLVSGECGASIKMAGRISTKMTNYFNKCLRKQGLELNDAGISILSSIFALTSNLFLPKQSKTPALQRHSIALLFTADKSIFDKNEHLKLFRSLF